MLASVRSSLFWSSVGLFLLGAVAVVARAVPDRFDVSCGGGGVVEVCVVVLVFRWDVVVLCSVLIGCDASCCVGAVRFFLLELGGSKVCGGVFVVVFCWDAVASCSVKVGCDAP